MLLLLLGLIACSPPPPVQDPPEADTDVALATPVGPLNGLWIYVSPGHGIAADRVATGRQRLEGYAGLTEDDWTARFASHHLIPRLESLGATVLDVRERSHTPLSATARRAVFEGLAHIERPVPMRAETEGLLRPRLAPDGSAEWEIRNPNNEQAPLYVTWIADAEADPAARYRVTVDGASRDVIVDQRVHGGQDYPLLMLPGDAYARVRLTGSGVGTLSVGTSRVGGGEQVLWSYTDEEEQSHPAWAIAGKHIQQRGGAPSYVWEPEGAGQAFDATTRARWAAWSHHADEPAVLLSLHTNAGGGTGSVSFVRNLCNGGPDCTPRALASTQLATSIHDGVVAVMQGYLPEWRDNGVIQNDLAEINEFLNPGMPGVLIEFGFHDHRVDAALLMQTEVQEELASAVADGVTAWWTAQPQTTLPSGSQ